MSEIFIGVDGGGTHCRAAVIDEAGHLLGYARGPSTNHHHAGWEGARQALTETISSVLASASIPSETARSIFLGLAGVTSAPDRRRFAEMVEPLSSLAQIVVDHDIRIALAGGLAGEPGIALISGTGSACYGRAQDGTTWQAGGWDAVADDVGSAYWLGQRGLNAAVRAADGRDRFTSLQPQIFDFLGIESLAQIMSRVGHLGRAEVATLAPLVLQAADRGDGKAEEICSSGADELALMIVTVGGKLGLDRATTSGGLALAPTYFGRIRSALQRRAPHISLQSPLLPPVLGAALLARQHGHANPAPAFIDQLRQISLPTT